MPTDPSNDPSGEPSDELQQLRAQARSDKKLMDRAARALAEIDRAQGLSNEQADVLAALRIRVEGKERGSLEDLLQVTKDLGAKKDLGDVLSGGGEKSDWPAEVKDTKKDWPGL